MVPEPSYVIPSGPALGSEKMLHYLLYKLFFTSDENWHGPVMDVNPLHY